MSLNNIKTKKIISDLFKNGYCVINNVLTIKECEKIIKNLKKLKKKVSNNKNFFDEASKKGQLIIRDLPLRDPKNYLKLIDNKLIIKILDGIFKETFILDNCQVSSTINVGKNYNSLTHIDSHLACKIPKDSSDVVACYCLEDFTKENGTTKVWPKSHLSGVRIQNDKNYSKRVKKNFKYVEAKKGSVIFFLGQTWHQIGKNRSSHRRWGILCHYKRWWIKPATDWTKCGAKIFKLLSKRQKELFGFTSISPRFDFEKQNSELKTLRKYKRLSSNYAKTIKF
jgi:ectoine hydroxylase-related dioxygenase (phytanoyl-CoA dioxygenase family)